MTTLGNVWHKVIGRVDFVDPPIAQFLFASPYASVLWLAARLYLGWKWLASGIDKLGNPAWMDTGAAVQGFWARAVVVPETGRPVVTYDWYRDFLQFMLDGGHYVWFAKLIAIGEVAIGVALVLGLFVGISAFGGAFMNWNFMMAGTASTNPVMFAISVALMLAWKNAGWIGLDRFLLPLLGTPWQPGRVFRHEEPRSTDGGAPKPVAPGKS